MSNSFYVTTFCNFAHRLKDGKPLNHECYVLPPRALRLEWFGRFEEAIELLSRAKPMKTHKGGKDGS